MVGPGPGGPGAAARPGRRRVRAGRPAVALGALTALALAAAGGCSSLPHYRPGHTYYVSASGDDGNDGRSADHAWRTLSRADRQQLVAGDRLLLQGGSRFPGSLTVGRNDAGQPKQPVVIGSYGSGRATIAPANGPGVTVVDTGGVEVRDLVVTGNDRTLKGPSGILLFSDRQGTQRLDHVVVSGVDVSRFAIGLAVGCADHAVGFHDVRVASSVVHDNTDDGLLTYGPRLDTKNPVYSHQDVVISGVQAYRNLGDPTSTHHNTGSGIVMGGVQGGRIEQSEAHDNGSNSAAKALEGPVGIWAYDSTGLTIEHNRSYHNHTPAIVDGSGFGLDQNVSSTTVQYNLAYGNDGPGYHAFTNFTNGAFRDDTIRFNISSNDGRKLAQNGGIDVHGADVRNLRIFNNTVVMTGTGAKQGPAVRLRKNPVGVSLRNNILITDGSPVVSAATAYTPQQVVLQGNDYFAASGSWQVRWGQSTYRSLGQWRDAQHQELVGGKPTGLTADPCLAGGRAPSISSAAQAPRIVPTCDAVAGKGVDLRKDFGIDPGPTDWFGTALSAPTLIGAADLHTR
ncbi:right-handed parallel beta-helix repeat-containing protein [Actinacidiphila rubida]|uniref:Right handed beta helix region n=1 Tax=Actinacidiphila rubida TaxID=310780 RepID=A0A1H8SS57_9ACTN|nr:right-handed parallel beta-helix repeat-containing protein [Actinacidiphila rubida]SEO81600.1 Right handed beta helix region [Actinacidiphila rubida]